MELSIQYFNRYMALSRVKCYARYKFDTMDFVESVASVNNKNERLHLLVTSVLTHIQS